MFKIERIQRIKDYMLEHRQVDVGTLSRMLHVSDATIRNDFDELEKEGYVTRFHGGAALNAIGYQEDEINNALTGNTIEYDQKKAELGSVASQLIEEKEWIFLGPGTTSYYIAKTLSQRNNMHVLTNNLLVANILGPNPFIQTLVLGGQINSEGLYTMPEDIQKDLKGFFLSKAFFSIDGIDLDAGYTLSDINVLNIINSISANCQETFFAIDSTKFGKRTFIKLGNMSYAQNVITNDSTPAKYKQYYLEHGIQLYTSSTLLTAQPNHPDDK